MDGFKWALRAFGCALVAVVLVSCGGSGMGSEETAVAAKVGTAEDNGYYWNAAEPGSGMFFEAQGNTGVLTLYMYDATGKPVWYLASGPIQRGQGTANFRGELLLDGKQTPVGGKSIGEVGVAFANGDAQVTLPGRAAYKVTRFFTKGAGPTGNQPKTGIYWDADRVFVPPGGGYTVEVNNGVAMVGVFRQDVEHSWYLAIVPLGGDIARGSAQRSRGGQTLAGPWKASTAFAIGGEFGVQFREPCRGVVVHPREAGENAAAIERFDFGGIADGADCRIGTSNITPLSPLAGAQPWTQHQGNAGHAGYVPVVVDPQKFSRRWVRKEIGALKSVVADGRICRLGAKIPASRSADPDYFVECLSEDKGDVVLTIPLGSPTWSPSGPVLSGGKIVVTTQRDRTFDSWLRLFDARTGAAAGQFPVPTFGMNELPVVTDSTAYVRGSVLLPAGGGEGVLYAVDLASGKATSIGGLAQASGDAAFSGGKLLVPGYDGLYVVQDVASKQHTRINELRITEPSGYWQRDSEHIVADGAGTAYTWVGGYNRLSRYDLGKAAATWSISSPYRTDPVVVGDTVYAVTFDDLEARSTADGSLRWSFKLREGYFTQRSQYPSLLVVGKHAFVSTGSGTVAVDLQTRKEVWRDPVEGYLSVSDNGILYIAGSYRFVAVNLR